MDTRQFPLLESGSSHPPCQRVILNDIYPHLVTDATCAGGEMGGVIVSAQWEYADYITSMVHQVRCPSEVKFNEVCV